MTVVEQPVCRPALLVEIILTMQVDHEREQVKDQHRDADSEDDDRDLGVRPIGGRNRSVFGHGGSLEAGATDAN